MGCCDICGAYADKVAGVADDECFFEGVTLDSSAILEGLCVPKCDDSCKAIFNVLRQTLHGAMSDSRSLAVSCGHNFGLRAVDGCRGEEHLHLVDSVWWPSARVEIGLNQRQIINPLTGDVCGAKVCLEAVGEGRSHRNALHRV